MRRLASAPKIIDVEIPYKPRRWAQPFHASLKRWAALVLHRRAGKTTSTLNHHQRAAIDDAWEAARLRHLEPKFTDAEITELLQHRQYGHILPLLGQAKSVAWEPLKRIASVVPGATPNESELSIKYRRQDKAPNRVTVPVSGALNPEAHSTTVRLFGADNPDAFRGLPFSGVAYDEYSQQRRRWRIISATASSKARSKARISSIGPTRRRSPTRNGSRSGRTSIARSRPKRARRSPPSAARCRTT
jgi:hypothetical protein